jgi:DNA invertase Pin-like site-specific DNA recombinase
MTTATTELIPAVMYLRMSDDDQTVSIERQDMEVRKLAKTGNYRLIRVYVDEGKSGSKDQDKRTDFNRLLLDATAEDFAAVLCYNASRFARLDTIDGAFAKQILRQHAVILHTVNEGVIDWRTQAGRMMDFMLSEQNHAYSRSLSKDSISGRVRALEAGCWPHGATPYGFDRMYTYGDQTTRISRTDRFRKPRGWTLKLVTNDQEAATVRHIFDQFVNKAQSMRQIAIALNADKVPPPDNLPRSQKLGWSNISVVGILRHRAYIGIAETGKGKKSAKTAFNRLPAAEKHGVCPALVERDLFDRAQELLDKNRDRKSRQQSSRCGVLSGFLRCHQCGYSLNKEQRGDGPTKYVCKSTGRTSSGCPQWFVGESEILPRVTARVVQAIDAEVLKLLDAPAAGPDRCGILTRHVESLTKKLATAQRRYMEADDDIAPDLQADLRRIKGELADAETALRQARTVENEGGVTSFVQWWEQQKDTVLFAVTVQTEYDGGTVTEMTFPNTLPDPEAEVIVNPQRPHDLGELKSVAFRPVSIDRAGFRALLNRLGVEVSVRWQKAEGTKRKGGNRRWVVDNANIDIDVNWSGPTTTSKHVESDRTGTC